MTKLNQNKHLDLLKEIADDRLSLLKILEAAGIVLPEGNLDAKVRDALKTHE